MTEFSFTDDIADEDTRRSTGGKDAAPNPYLAAVQAIALKKDDKGNPLAKSFVTTKPADEVEYTKFVAKVKRQLSAAGDVSDPRVTVRLAEKPVKKVVAGKETSIVDDSRVKLVFWTIPRKDHKKGEAPTAPVTQTTTA